LDILSSSVSCTSAVVGGTAIVGASAGGLTVAAGKI
jgi:hypothetical protein